MSLRAMAQSPKLACIRASRDARKFADGELVLKGAVRDEAGAVLVLALVFLLAVGGIITGLLGWSGNDLKNTGTFKSARSLVYAAGGVTEVAIWTARYSFTSPSSLPIACSGTSPSVNIDGEFIEDWCKTVPGTGSLSATRVLTVSACQVPSATGLPSICTNPFLVATVTFNDFTTPGNVDNCSTTGASCGTAMTLKSWVVK
jgi:hypothetical protein